MESGGTEGRTQIGSEGCPGSLDKKKESTHKVHTERGSAFIHMGGWSFSWEKIEQDKGPNV